MPTAMKFTKDQPDDEFVHTLFGYVKGVDAQKARRHDDVLGRPEKRTETRAAAEQLSRQCHEFVTAGADKIASQMKGAGVREDATLILQAALTRAHGMLEGGSGTGKTMLVEQASEVLDFPYERLDGQFDLSDIQIIGVEMPTADGTFELRRGLLLKPCLSFQIDEAKRVSASAMNALLQALENRSVMVGSLRGSGQSRVQLSPGFTAVCTANPDTYAGSSGSNEAFLDRLFYGRRMSIPDHDDLVDLVLESKFVRARHEPLPLPANLYEIWSAIEFVEVPRLMAEAIVNANYYVSPREVAAEAGWTRCSFHPTRRQQGQIDQLSKDTATYLTEGSNPRGIRGTALQARANAFFRGSLTVDIADVRRAAQDALLFRLKPYPGTSPRLVADIITRALDLTLPVD